MSQIVLEIQTNDGPNIKELRFAATTRIDDLRSRLEMISGASEATMQLYFHDTEGKLIGQATDGSQTILDFHTPGAELRLQLRIKDANLKVSDDLSSVEKFEITDDEYSQRRDTVRSYKMANKVGRFSEDSLAKEAEEEKAIESMRIGNRCEVRMENAQPRRGTVMFKGALKGKLGSFVGIKYDEPLGKNDGSLEGERYFTCQPNYGGFVKPKFVTIGDYPEEEINFDD